MTGDGRKFFIQAQALVQARSYEAALEKLMLAAGEAPRNARTRFNLALIFGQLKNYPAAMDQMRCYLQLAPDAADAQQAKDHIDKWETIKEVEEAKVVQPLLDGCNAGKGDDCVNLGLTYENGKGVAPDALKAAEFYRKACDMETGVGCYNLGIFYASGRAVTKDESLAADFYRKACVLGYSWGCTNLASRVSAKDVAMASRLYRRACFLDDELACLNLGKYYAAGTGVGRDQLEARVLLGKSCEKGNKEGCDRLLQETGSASVNEDLCNLRHPSAYSCFTLGLMYEHGVGVTKDLEKAVELYRKACDLGGDDILVNGRGCSSLARCYNQGVGVKPNEAKGWKLARKACDLGDRAGCSMISTYYFIVGKYGQLEETGRKACEMDDASACFHLGWALDNRKDKDKADEAFKKACGLGEMTACHRFGDSEWAQIVESALGGLHPAEVKGDGTADWASRTAQYRSRFHGGDTTGLSDEISAAFDKAGLLHSRDAKELLTIEPTTTGADGAFLVRVRSSPENYARFSDEQKARLKNLLLEPGNDGSVNMQFRFANDDLDSRVEQFEKSILGVYASLKTDEKR